MLDSPMMVTPCFTTVLFISLNAQLPPASTAISTITDPSRMLFTISSVINTGAADSKWGIRVLIGVSTPSPAAGAGGVAFLGAFGAQFIPTDDVPCFAFSDAQGNDSFVIYLTCVHEGGHTLGLNHDGEIPDLSNIEAIHLVQRTGADKKTIQGRVHFVLVERIGATTIESGLNEKIVLAAVDAALADLVHV